MNIFVGNLPFGTTDEELHELFEQHGEIARATVVKDRVTGKSRGFGFVVCDDPDIGDILIHFSVLQDHGRRSLPEGARVECIAVNYPGH